MGGIEHVSDGEGPSGAHSYRGLAVEEAIRAWSFESVWALLVDGEVGSPLPPAEAFPLPIRTGDHRVDMQAALAGLAPVWGFTSLPTTSPAAARTSLARASVMALSFLAQSARGPDVPAVPDWVVDQVSGIARRFLTRWLGEADERRVRAINAGWVAIAAAPGCPSLEVARHTAATGADIAACLAAAVAASSGPLVAGAAARLAEVLTTAPGGAQVREFRRQWGFARRPSPHTSPQVEALEEVSREVGSEYKVVAAHAAEIAHYTHPRFPTEQLLTTLWVTHLFTFAGVPPRMLTAMFACGKTAGWSATIVTEHSRLLEKLNR